MKHAISVVVLSTALLSGCVVAKSPAESRADHVAQVKSTSEAVGTPGVADPLHAVKLIGNDYIGGKDVPINVSIGNGFTKAMIQDEPATVKRVSPTFYEIKGSGYIVSVTVNNNGVEFANWNKTKGRTHGGLNIVKGE